MQDAHPCMLNYFDAFDDLFDVFDGIFITLTIATYSNADETSREY
jgi:hypothetical protein